MSFEVAIVGGCCLKGGVHGDDDFSKILEDEFFRVVDHGWSCEVLEGLTEGAPKKFQYWPIRVVGWRQCRSGGANVDPVAPMSIRWRQ